MAWWVTNRDQAPSHNIIHPWKKPTSSVCRGYKKKLLAPKCGCWWLVEDELGEWWAVAEDGLKAYCIHKFQFIFCGIHIGDAGCSLDWLVRYELWLGNQLPFWTINWTPWLLDAAQNPSHEDALFRCLQTLKGGIRPSRDMYKLANADNPSETFKCNLELINFMPQILPGSAFTQCISKLF